MSTEKEPGIDTLCSSATELQKQVVAEEKDPGIDTLCSSATELQKQVVAEERDVLENVEGPSTAKIKPFHVDSSMIKSVPLAEQAAELKELGLYSVYDQTELEQGILQQVDSAINAEQEKQAKKHAEKELNSVLNEIRSTKDEINHIDKVMRSIILPSGNSFGNKDSHRTLVSIKSQKELKNKQLKKLRSRHRFLLATLSGTPEGLQDDLLQDEDQDQDESFNILKNLLTGGQTNPADKETEEDRLIRLGEMTPFGTTLKPITPQPAAPPLLTDFEKYMLEQVELASKKKSLHGRKKGIKRKGINDQKDLKKKLKGAIDECNQLDKEKEKKDVDSFRVSSEEELKSVEDQLYSSSTFERNAKPSTEMRPNWQSDSEISEVELSDEDYNPDPEEWKSSDNDSLSKVSSKKHIEKSKKKKSSMLGRQLMNAGDTKRKQRGKNTEYKCKTCDDGNKEIFYKRLRENKKARLREKQAKIERGESDSDSDQEDINFEGGWRLPQRIWKKLYRYQQTAVKWLWELHQQECGGIVGDEMGLGKTIQIITFLAGLKYSQLYNKTLGYNGLGPVVIICPTTIMHQWLKEFHTWWPQFRVAILHDSGSFLGSKASLVHDIVKTHSVLVTSYSGARLNKDILLKHQWHYVILDEGHKIRNPNAEVTVVCKQFRTCHRLILSGSPVQNNLKELWSLIDFVFPGKLGTLPDFMQQFSVPITMGGYANATPVQVQTAYKCACVLRDTINPYLLRRMKDDVKKSMQLPKKNEQVLFCRLTEEQRSTYEEYLKSKECQMILNREYQVFAGLITLRKICNHPDLSTGGPRVPLGADESSDDRYQFGFWKRSGKMIVIESLLKIWKEQNHKVLLFSQSKQMLDILEYFVKNKYKYMRMDGSTAISSRQPAINKFNNDPSIFLFLLTTRVGGVGVNLTGANRVVIFDPDWNPSTDTQARERAWRIGQNRQVTVYRLLTTGTIEEKIYHRQIFKQFLTNRVLKDPQQRRFFKSNDLFELFTLGSEDNVHGNETNALFAGTGATIVSKAPTKTLDTHPRPVKRESVLNKTFKKFKPQTTTSKKHSNPLDINIPSKGELSVNNKPTQTEVNKINQLKSFNSNSSDIGNIEFKDNLKPISNVKKAEEPKNSEENNENASGRNKSHETNCKDNPEDKETVHQIDEHGACKAPSSKPEDKETVHQQVEHGACKAPSSKPEDKETVHQIDEHGACKAPSSKPGDKETVHQQVEHGACKAPSSKPEDKETVHQQVEHGACKAPSSKPEDKETVHQQVEHGACKAPSSKPEDKETVHQIDEHGACKAPSSKPGDKETVHQQVEHGACKAPSSKPEDKETVHQQVERGACKAPSSKPEDKETVHQIDEHGACKAPSSKPEDKETVHQQVEHGACKAPSSKPEDKETVHHNEDHGPCRVTSSKPEDKETVHHNEDHGPCRVTSSKPEDMTEWKAKERKKIEKLKKKLLKLQNESKKRKKLEKKKKKKVKDACLEGKKIAYLSRHSVFQQSNAEVDSSKQDDYVLQKLFKKNGVQSAMKHDVIMESSNPDYILVEKEAERVAKEAAIALKRSRRRCMPASSGIPTWTGSVSSAGSPAKTDKPRFGLKKNSKIAELNFSTSTSPGKKQESKPKFGSKKLFNGAMSGHSFTKNSITNGVLPSSAELLSSMRARNDITDDDAIGTVQSSEKAALLQDLHTFISFQASVDGQATTSEILQRFRNQIPTQDSAVFRSLLHEICDLIKMSDGHAVWRLRPSFR